MTENQSAPPESRRDKAKDPNAGHRERLRKRFLHDSAGMEDYEILELLLGYALPRRDTRLLAKELLGRFGGIDGILSAAAESLQDVPGAGPGVALYCRISGTAAGSVLHAASRHGVRPASPRLLPA